MATDQFSRFVQASVRHIDNIAQKRFSLYEKDVPESVLSVSELEEMQAKDENPHRQAAHQRAIDIIQGAARARDIRKLSHQDYIRSYLSSAVDRKASLERFLRNHEGSSL